MFSQQVDIHEDFQRPETSPVATSENGFYYYLDNGEFRNKLQGTTAQPDISPVEVCSSKFVNLLISLALVHEGAQDYQESQHRLRELISGAFGKKDFPQKIDLQYLKSLGTRNIAAQSCDPKINEQISRIKKTPGKYLERLFKQNIAKVESDQLMNIMMSESGSSSADLQSIISARMFQANEDGECPPQDQDFFFSIPLRRIAREKIEEIIRKQGNSHHTIHILKVIKDPEEPLSFQEISEAIKGSSHGSPEQGAARIQSVDIFNIGTIYQEQNNTYYLVVKYGPTYIKTFTDPKLVLTADGFKIMCTRNKKSRKKDRIEAHLMKEIFEEDMGLKARTSTPTTHFPVLFENFEGENAESANIILRKVQENCASMVQSEAEIIIRYVTERTIPSVQKLLSIQRFYTALLKLVDVYKNSQLDDNAPDPNHTKIKFLLLALQNDNSDVPGLGKSYRSTLLWLRSFTDAIESTLEIIAEKAVS